MHYSNAKHHKKAKPRRREVFAKNYRWIQAVFVNRMSMLCHDSSGYISHRRQHAIPA